MTSCMRQPRLVAPQNPFYLSVERNKTIESYGLSMRFCETKPNLLARVPAALWERELVHASVRRHGNIGLRKIAPLAQQRARGVLSQGVSKAVAEIKLRWVSSAAIATECLARKVGLPGCERNNLDLEFRKQEIEIARAFITTASLHDDAGLDQICG